MCSVKRRCPFAGQSCVRVCLGRSYLVSLCVVTLDNPRTIPGRPSLACLTMAIAGCSDSPVGSVRTLPRFNSWAGKASVAGARQPGVPSGLRSRRSGFSDFGGVAGIGPLSDGVGGVSTSCVTTARSRAIPFRVRVVCLTTGTSSSRKPCHPWEMDDSLSGDFEWQPVDTVEELAEHIDRDEMLDGLRIADQVKFWAIYPGLYKAVVDGTTIPTPDRQLSPKKVKLGHRETTVGARKRPARDRNWHTKKTSYDSHPGRKLMNRLTPIT